MRTAFNGCIIYLEGLGDSILNHYPFFNKLRNNGFRVLLFDYLGQGGSEGNMSETRVTSKGDPFPKSKKYEIGEQAKFVWNRYAKIDNTISTNSCKNHPKRIIGWSTGGLAAYRLANEGWADQVILIAPGIAPKYCVGEAGGKGLIDCLNTVLDTDKTTITERTLTKNTFAQGNNPHLDKVKPDNFRQIKEFAINLLSTAYIQAPFWKIPKSKKGLVFLSGADDTYVNKDQTISILKKNAPHFQTTVYENALHEIDNEVPEISEEMHQKTIDFFIRN